MVQFQTLGELSNHLETAGGILDFADAGVPLSDVSLAVDESAVLRNQPSVRKVTSFIAHKVSAVPIHLHRRLSDTDRERVTDHPLSRALREPVKRMTSARFWHDVMMDRLIHDRFCLVWGWDDDERLTLTRIPARRTRFYGDGLGTVVLVKVAMPNGRVEELLPEQCVIDVGYSVGVSANGLSPLETLSDILNESSEAVKYRRSVWENGARIPQVVKRPAAAPKWSKEARSRFMRGLEAFRKGGGKEGAWLLLEDDMEISGASTGAFRPKDTLDLEGRKLTDIEVAAAYHVPPELVGAREGTYSNIDAFQKMLYGPVLGHHFVRNEQALNVQLLPAVADDPDVYAEYAIEAMMRGSFLDQAKVGQTVVGRPTMTVNEWRSRMNMPRVDGGDDLIVPMNVTVGGQASPTDVAGRPADE